MTAALGEGRATSRAAGGEAPAEGFRGSLHRWQAAVAACFGLFVFVTNRWEGGGRVHPWANDVVAYEKLAAAAPGLPDGPRLPNAYTERFVPHWVVGVFHKLTGAGLHASYHLAAALVAALLVYLAARVLASLEPADWVYVVALGAFLFAPYDDIREKLTVPGGVQDLVFVLGVAVALLGLLRVSFPAVLGGICLAIVSRQGTLLVAPVASLWVLVGPGWRALPARRRVIEAVSVSAACGIVYVALRAITAGISKSFAPQSPSDTIFFATPHPGALASHFGRCAIVLVVVAPVLFAALAIVRAHGIRARRLPPALWLSLLMGLVLLAEPAVIRPDFRGFASNEQRLAGMSLLPFCVALALTLDLAVRVGAVRRPSRGELVALCGLLAAGSLHHFFTWFGPQSLGQFLVLEALAAAGVVAILVRLARDGTAAVEVAPAT